MELDRLWNWQKKKLACRIRPENGNPAGDSLREMFAELAGVDLNELLNEMKQAKKKKEQTDKVSVDFEAEKTFKDVLGRSRILGATKLALEKMEEADKIKNETLTQKNVKKVFTVLPKSPPKRVLMDLQRERAKPLRLPDQEEHKLATEKLEKKLAKQRAARMAAIEQSAKSDEAGKKVVKDFANSLVKSQVLRGYEGDLFSTGGPYLEGMLYLSRMADSTKRLGMAFSENDKKKQEETIVSLESEKKNDREAGSSELFESSTGEVSTNPDVNAKLSCAVSLCNWSRNPANAARLASEGAVRAIMQLSLEPVMRITIFCAAAFRFMSEHPTLAIAMIEEGAITTISELVSASTDDFIQYNLAIALVNLTRINGREGQVVEAAIVLALMNLVMLKPELGATCVRGLYNLTCVDVSYPSIERVIRALVSLSLSGTSNVKHLCAAALCNLSDLKSVRARMVEEGAINVLTALSRGAETRTRRICAVILQNLSAAKSVRVEMASRNSVAAAYGLSSDQDPIILRCIGLTLSRLSMESTNCQRIIHEGGIAALCNIAVKYPTIPGITQPVASAFQLLSSNQPYRINIVNEGSVTAVASLLRSSVDLFTLQHSLLALCNLLCEPENHLPIIQQGLILTLVGMCSNENELLRDFCSLAFLNLSCAEDSRKHLVNGGAVAAIISIAKQDSAMTKKRCAATLCNLSYFAAGMSRMVSDGIIPSIVDLVLAKDIVTVHYSCAALCRLCSTVENAKLILDSGAVPNLVQGAIDGDHVTKQFCGSVLSSLSFYEYCRIPLCDLGAIGALKGLAELNDDITKQRCLVAFANLSCEVSVQLKMVNEGVVGIIAELANSYQEINYICCAKAICNLACYENTKSIVAKEGGVHALMMISMVQSVDRLTKLLCVLGLNNLLDETTVDFMVAEGLVGSIANLSKIGDSHISNLCSKIFNHLSKYPVARTKMIERNSTLNAIYKLCQLPQHSSSSGGHNIMHSAHHSHPQSASSGGSHETQVIAIRTCCNLLFDHSIREAVVKSGILLTLEKTLENPFFDAEVMNQIFLALLSLCTNSSFMESISKTNIPSILIHLVLQVRANPSSSSSSMTSSSSALIQEKEFEIITKILGMLAYDLKSRLFLQKKEFLLLIFQLIKQRIDSPSVVWCIFALRHLIVDYAIPHELFEIGIKSTLLTIHDAFQQQIKRLSSGASALNKLSSAESVLHFRVYKSLVECLRSLSEGGEELDKTGYNDLEQLACLPVLQLLQRAVEYFTEFREYFTPLNTTPVHATSSKQSSLANSQNSIEEWTKYHIAVLIARFANAGPSIRQATATTETCFVLEKLSTSAKCAELVTVSLGLYLFDTKARLPFLTPPIAGVLVHLHGYQLTENTKSNLVLAIYGMSKVASCREFMLATHLQMDRILVQLSGAESAKIKANVNRAYKNLHSDINEAIEEGAVATLIAMSLEGKLKNQSSDDFIVPPIYPQSEQKLAPPEYSSSDLLADENDRAPIRWYARITVTKGGAAGKGPDPPEPPPMSTDGSAQYPHLMEELDGGEIEGKTRMAFAKMQIPSNLKDSYLLTDADFMILDEREEVNLTETQSVNEKDMMLETVEDPLNSTSSPNTGNTGGDNGHDNNSAASGTRKVQKAGSRGRNNLSRSSTANTIENDNNSSATNSLKGDSVGDERRSRRQKTVANLSERSRSPDGASERVRKSRKSNPLPANSGSNKNASSKGDVSMNEQAAKLGLYY